MYSFLSASQMRQPSPRVMKTGSRPTDLNARAGEFTPPGIDCWAWAKSALDLLCPIESITPDPPLFGPNGGMGPAFRRQIKLQSISKERLVRPAQLCSLSRRRTPSECRAASLRSRGSRSQSWPNSHRCPALCWRSPNGCTAPDPDSWKCRGGTQRPRSLAPTCGLLVLRRNSGRSSTDNKPVSCLDISHRAQETSDRSGKDWPPRRASIICRHDSAATSIPATSRGSSGRPSGSACRWKSSCAG